MVGTFTFDAFKSVFGDTMLFEESLTTEGCNRIMGGSKLIRLEFVLDPEEALQSATIEFPYFLSDAGSNREISEQVIRFLEVCLPSDVTPQSWIQEATRHLKGKDETEFEARYEDILICLFQMKPKLLFFLTAQRI